LVQSVGRSKPKKLLADITLIAGADVRDDFVRHTCEVLHVGKPQRAALMAIRDECAIDP
jgi:hypothetical protein